MEENGHIVFSLTHPPNSQKLYLPLLDFKKFRTKYL